MSKYAISLTTIPPRLPRIGPVVDSLLAQRPAPVGVFVYIPKVWDRFEAGDVVCNLPDGAEIHIVEDDVGPCMKAICFSDDHQKTAQRLIYCDDDWIYPQGWAGALLAAGSPDQAVAASGFDVGRLKRSAPPKDPDFVDIAQGFAGVSIDPKWFDLPDIVPPEQARLADDVWLSGQLARQGIPILHCPEARAGLRPAFEDGHGLQDVMEAGQTRAEVYRATLDLLTQRYGIWPRV